MEKLRKEVGVGEKSCLKWAEHVKIMQEEQLRV